MYRCLHEWSSHRGQKRVAFCDTGSQKLYSCQKSLLFLLNGRFFKHTKVSVNENEEWELRTYLHCGFHLTLSHLFTSTLTLSA